MLTNEKLNRRINFALRAVNDVVVAVADSALSSRSAHVEQLSEALAALSNTQREIYKVNPELEYHFDESRAPTAYMVMFRAHLDTADALLAAGNTDEALEELRIALAMEPPPLAHELLVEKIKEVATRRGE